MSDSNEAKFVFQRRDGKKLSRDQALLLVKAMREQFAEEFWIWHEDPTMPPERPILISDEIKPEHASVEIRRTVALESIAASLEKIANPPFLVTVEEVDTEAQAENAFLRRRIERYRRALNKIAVATEIMPLQQRVVYQMETAKNALLLCAPYGDDDLRVPVH